MIVLLILATSLAIGSGHRPHHPTVPALFDVCLELLDRAQLEDVTDEMLIDVRIACQ